MRRVLPVLLAVLSVAGCSGDDTFDLAVGDARLTVEVVDTPESRAQGLMFREELPEDHGMLFVFEDAAIRAFYMRNTSIPLSIAYADERLVIVDIHDMEAFSEENVISRAPAMYALEVNQGSFRRWGVKPGDRLVLSSELSRRINRR